MFSAIRRWRRPKSRLSAMTHALPGRHRKHRHVRGLKATRR